ncbi:MAG: nucleotide exchange factor GrpE [Candidatus Methanoplasma sp.]|jgi:molecular chaperone GrpE (heat shock protein)|nr:nucleotide exchange factor GrpE [Candidatus Methanoplasma sp.]
MIEKKRSSKTSKLRNFLVTGSIEDEEDDRTAAEEEISYGGRFEEYPEDEASEEIIEEGGAAYDAAEEEQTAEPEEKDTDRQIVPGTDVSVLESEIADLREAVAKLTSELGKYTTSREQLKEYSLIMSKRDAELSNRKFIGMLEQLSAMREDFFKLCKGMNAKLDSFSTKDMIDSFEAYGVDMENILSDCGVRIGRSDCERLNTMSQRIIDVIPTDDESMNGMIAERVSDGYDYQGRILLKEKVKVYRFSENGKKEGDEGK